MKEITLVASSWRDRDDFYDALLAALGAPPWHGRSLDALNDTIGGNDINSVKLPFRIVILDTRTIPPELGSYIDRFAELVRDLQVLGGRDIHLSLE